MGELRPYAKSARELIERHLAGYEAWLGVMDRADVERSLFFETGRNTLKVHGNPVRLNQQGTVELRRIDGNYPEVVLAVTALVHGTASRVRRDGLAVEPDNRVCTFEVEGHRLSVPGFGYLDGNLSYAAATEGVGNPGVFAYLNSVFEFAVSGDQESEYLVGLRSPEGLYETTESRILRNLSLATHISRDEGLRLLRAACDEFEEQVSSLHQETLGKLLPGSSKARRR